MNKDRKSGVLSLDIGGANLKAADADGFARSQFFPLWRTPELLADAVAALVAGAPPHDRWAVTMTGELADCFRTKREGVAAIVDAVVDAASRIAPTPDVAVYLIDGTFVAPAEAKARGLEAAASNWHALASFVARRFPTRSGLLIDVGSTTADLIPFADGRVAAVGRNDPERLASGELVYTGVVRSPVCAIVKSLPWHGAPCRVAQELFATALDAYLVLGSVAEDIENTNTADGRAATIEFAVERLARCLCADRELFSLDDAQDCAQVIADAQLQSLAEAYLQVVSRSSIPELIVFSGQGEFLAQRLPACVGFAGRLLSLSDEIGPNASEVAPAYALANLALQGRSS